ncbi:MAG TPA: PKD domain-containing protein [Anaerolineae bacterium]|nr:PKD domain-containing protein [Anaerolineae bacterium]
MSCSLDLKRTVRVTAAILLSILLLPAAPASGSRARLPLPAAVASAGQPIQGAERGSGVAAWTRALDPTIVPGSQLPLFGGVTLGDLFVYAYRDGAWVEVPFQIDEVDSTGAFVVVEDGVLDSNDQVVFMAADLGDTATPYEWLDDVDSQGYPRYEVEITNPLDTAEKGWAYVYRSATLASTFAPYVTWDGANNRAVGETYIAGYNPASHLGMDSLELNGTGVDVLDRAKIRVAGQCKFFGYWQPFSITEDDITNQPVTPDIQGPVRLGGGTLDSQAWNYASLMEARAQFDAGDTIPPCEDIDYSLVRFSDDWRNPFESGMQPMTFYDGNTPGGVPVDGSPDSVPTSPVVPWTQISGARGSLVRVAEIDAGGGAASNYYKDNSVTDPGDTGDKKSFGDTGYRLDNPNSMVTLTFANYVLPANQGNVGETYAQYHANPLQVAASAQAYVEPAQAGFVGAPTSGLVPLLVSFTNQSSGEYDTCEWTFGDGAASSLCEDPTHTYAAAGLYTVALTVSGPGGTDTLTRTSYIAVYEPVVAGFAGYPTNGLVPLLVSFTNQSDGDYTSCEWTFGDGGTSSSCQNPTHTYTAAGVYTVTLTVSGPGGTDTLTRTDYISAYEPAAANFSGEPTGGAPPLLVTFTNLSSGDYTECTWSFGDSGTSDSCSDQPHTYEASGVYTVSLTVSGPGGTSTHTRPEYITVGEGLQAAFTGYPTQGGAPLLVEFVNSSTGDFDTCAWDFGDGGTSGSCGDPSHTYLTPGDYTVSLTVSGPGGTDTLTRTNYISAYDAVHAGFSGDPLRGVKPLEVTFTNSSTGYFDTCAWTFGDGGSSSDCNDPVHTYSVAGTYTVVLTASGPGGTDTEIRLDYVEVLSAHLIYLPTVLRGYTGPLQ